MIRTYGSGARQTHRTVTPVVIWCLYAWHQRSYGAAPAVGGEYGPRRLPGPWIQEVLQQVEPLGMVNKWSKTWIGTCLSSC